MLIEIDIGKLCARKCAKRLINENVTIITCIYSVGKANRVCVIYSITTVYLSKIIFTEIVRSTK